MRITTSKRKKITMRIKISKRKKIPYLTFCAFYAFYPFYACEITPNNLIYYTTPLDDALKSIKREQAILLRCFKKA